jgi:hypothetical protein
VTLAVIVVAQAATIVWLWPDARRMRRAAAETRIVQAISRRGSEGAFALDVMREAAVGSAVLYESLARMERDGVLDSWLDAAPIGMPRKRYRLAGDEFKAPQ